MVSRRIPKPEDLTFSTDGDPLPETQNGWVTEEFRCDQNPEYFARLHWNKRLRKMFVQYFAPGLHGSSPTLKELIAQLEKTHGKN